MKREKINKKTKEKRWCLVHKEREREREREREEREQETGGLL